MIGLQTKLSDCQLHLHLTGMVLFRDWKSYVYYQIHRVLLNYNSKEHSTNPQWIGFDSRQSLCLSSHLSADQQTGSDRAQKHPSSPVPEDNKHQEGKEAVENLPANLKYKKFSSASYAWHRGCLVTQQIRNSCYSSSCPLHLHDQQLVIFSLFQEQANSSCILQCDLRPYWMEH